MPSATPSIRFSDSPIIDAFGRMRVSNPVTLFDSQAQYHTGALVWNNNTVGGGTVTHLPYESSVQLSCGTASGDLASRQSKKYFRYQPGKSQLIFMTAVLGPSKANVRQRVGYFDSRNGLYFEQTSSGLSVARRSYISGSNGTILNDLTGSTLWNIDKFDGTGPSGKTINTALAQIFAIDYEWLGVGRARFGFVIDGKLYYCHEMNHANATPFTSVYMTTPNLPVRYEIENTAGAASATSMKAICASVISEGGFEDDRAYTYGIDKTAVSVDATRRPLLTIRPKLSYGSTGSLHNRTNVEIAGIDVIATTVPVLWEIVLNATLNTSSFVDFNTQHSSVEYATGSATHTATGGITIFNGLVQASGGVLATPGSESREITNRIPLTISENATSADTYTLACTGIGGTATVSTCLRWREIY